MKTSLIIPFKNEVDYAATTLKRLHTFLTEHQLDFELIAVDDSTDDTWQILQSFAKQHENVLLVQGGEPPSYGKALQAGFSAATGDILIPFNGDLSDSPADLLIYIHLIEQGNDMVFGSRFMQGANVSGSTVVKGMISRIGNAFLQLLFQTTCSDLTNSFKAYRRTVLEEIQPTAIGYNISMEIALKGIRGRYTYTTIPVTWTGRKYGRSKMSLLKAIPPYLATALRIRFVSVAPAPVTWLP